MQVEVQPKELSSAIGAVTSIMKKMPREIATTDAALAILLDKDWNYRLVASFDAFTVSIPLVSMRTIGTNDVLEPWTGGAVVQDNVIGIVDEAEMQKVLSKIDAKKYPTITLDYSKGAGYLSIKTDNNDFYKIAVSMPKKVISNFGIIANDTPALDLSEDEFTSLCSIIGSIADALMTTEATEHLALGCVFLSSEPDYETGKPILRISGTSIGDGFSIICNTDTPAHANFTALLPKELASGLKGFMKSINGIGATKIGIVADDSGHARLLCLHNEVFSLWLSCMIDSFPFASIDTALDAVADPPVMAVVPVKQFRSMLDRITGVSLKGSKDDQYTSIILYDGGALQLRQYGVNVGGATGVVSTETMDVDRIVKFDDTVSEMQTLIRTSSLKKMVTFFNDDFVYMAISHPRRGSSGKMTLSTGERLKQALTIILLGATI